MTTANQPRIFLLDENVPKKVHTSLREAGYQVTRVRDESLGSQPDSAVFIHARARYMTIITFDTDYLDRAKFPPPHAGILVLRFFPRGNANTIIAASVLQAITKLKSSDISNHVYIVTPDKLEEIF